MRKITIITLLIVVIGLISVYSSSYVWALYKYNDSLYFFKRQFIFMIIGIVAMFVVSKINYQSYKKHYKVILALSYILLVLVLVPGIGMVRGGSRSWFNLGVFALQPSEIFKIAIIIYSAVYIEKHYRDMKKLKVSLKLLFVIGFGFLLIMMQPDFGSGVVMVCGALITIIVSPFSFKYFIGLGILGVLSLVGMIVSAPYRLERILSFINPFLDPLGSGFQAIQALYAIVPGGLLGVGFNNSIQKHFYLPEPQTDFIFAIVAEESGFLGASFLVLLYFYLFYLVISLSKDADDLFGSLLSLGLISVIAVQTFINLGVVVGLLPVTGVTLPLMSYGGTSLVVTMASIGIILNVTKK